MVKIQINPIYCGSKEKLPKGKVRGRPNQCYILGRKAGYYAGILKVTGDRQTIPIIPSGIPKASNQGIPLYSYTPINRRGVIQATEASLLAQQRRQKMRTEAQWRSLNQRALQAQAREWNIPNYGRTKNALIEDFIREARRRGLVIQ